MTWKFSRGTIVFVAVALAIPVGLTIFLVGGKVLDSTARSVRESEERQAREREQAARDARSSAQRIEAQRTATTNAAAIRSAQAAGLAATGWGSSSLEEIAAGISTKRCAVVADRTMPFSRIGSHLARVASIAFATKPDASRSRYLAIGMEGKPGDIDGFDAWSIAYAHEAPVLRIEKGSTSTDDLYGLSAIVLRGPANALVCRGSTAWLVIDPDSNLAATPDQLPAVEQRIAADVERRDQQIYDLLRSRPRQVGRYNTRNTYRVPWLLTGTSMDDRQHLVMQMAFPQAVAAITVHGSIDHGELHLAPAPGQDLHAVPITEAGLALSLDGTRDGLGGMLSSAAGPYRCWLPYASETVAGHPISDWTGTWTGTISGSTGEMAAQMNLALDDTWQGRGTIAQGGTSVPLKVMLADDSVWCLRTDQAASAPFQLRQERAAGRAGTLLVGNGPMGRIAMARATAPSIETAPRRP